MKNIIFIYVFVVSLLFIQGQARTFNDIIEMKEYGVNEEEILKDIEKYNIDVPVNKEVFFKLKNEGFSTNFIRRLRQMMEKKKGKKAKEKIDKPFSKVKPKKGKYYTLSVKISPPGSGSLLMYPKSKRNHFPEGTLIRIKPRPVYPYYFSHFTGDIKGFQPVAIKLSRNINVTVHFKKSAKVDPPPKIEDPKEFKDTRKKGYLYKGEVVGIVQGRGINKDWGFANEAEYKYIYQLEYTSTVLSNDGYTIKEHRTFHTVNEIFMVSKNKFHLDIGDDLSWVKNTAKGLGEALYLYGKATSNLKATLIGKMIKGGVYLGEFVIDTVEKVSITGKQIQDVCDIVQKYSGKNINFQEFERQFAKRTMGRVLGYAPNMKMLQGKTFVLTYEDGVGLTKIDVLGDDIITVREKDLLQRAFYLSDYYIFKDKNQPAKKIREGDSWQVDSRTLAGIIDPRLRHKSKGLINLTRARNTIIGKEEVANFIINKGLMKMYSLDREEEIIGKASIKQGSVLYDLRKRYVRRASINGTVNYKQVSKNHFFFKARLTGTPTMTIKYKCECVKK